MVGADRNRLETGAGAERSENSEAEGEGMAPATEGTATTTPATELSDLETGSGEEEESLGASGSSGAEWIGAEEYSHTLTPDNQRYTGLFSK